MKTRHLLQSGLLTLFLLGFVISVGPELRDVLDDAARHDEREIVKLWRAAYPNVEHDYVDTERGCSVLRI